MQQVVVPVRYPLTNHSRRTLAEAIRIAEAEDADLTVLHVNLYQNSHRVSRRELKDGVEEEFGHLPRSRYIVRSGMLVEETILDEVAASGADVVVIGSKQVSRWRSMIRRSSTTRTSNGSSGRNWTVTSSRSRSRASPPVTPRRTRTTEAGRRRSPDRVSDRPRRRSRPS